MICPQSKKPKLSIDSSNCKLSNSTSRFVRCWNNYLKRYTIRNRQSCTCDDCKKHPNRIDDGCCCSVCVCADTKKELEALFYGIGDHQDIAPEEMDDLLYRMSLTAAIDSR